MLNIRAIVEIATIFSTKKVGKSNPIIVYLFSFAQTYRMSILNINQPNPSRSGKTLRIALGAGAIAFVVAIASTLAANININSGPVEFGQGVAQTTACDDAITLTPSSTFINLSDTSSAGLFLFSGIQVSDIDSSVGKCQGKTLSIKAYGETETVALDSYAVYVGDTGFTSGDGTITDSGIGTSSSSFSLTFNSVSVSASDVYKITVESSERTNNAGIPWSAVTWQGSTESGPSIYADSLTLGKPSWFDEVTTGGNLSYSFSSDGMGMEGDADGLTFPYISTFVIPHDQKVKIEFVFGYYSRCDDQGVILFSESATPMWSWGETDNGLISQWNCGFPELGWPTGSTSSGGPENESILEIGTAYIGIVEYDPDLSDANLRMTTKSYSGEIIDTKYVSQLLAPGEDYKIGFSADADGDGEDPLGMAFFKNLKITIG
jgi:hypothetical protein